MTMPLAKLDLLLGYGIAFAAVAAAQATLVSLVAFGAARPARRRARAWLVVVLAVSNAILGMALGLFLSAFARTEFQAVQFMPAVVLPQILLCGLFVPRDQMARLLEISRRSAAHIRLRRAATRERRPARRTPCLRRGDRGGGDAAGARARRSNPPPADALGATGSGAPPPA